MTSFHDIGFDETAQRILAHRLYEQDCDLSTLIKQALICYDRVMGMQEAGMRLFAQQDGVINPIVFT